MTTETRVLVLCHGNVNRSPLCAALLEVLRPDLEVRSAGVKDDAHGPPTKKLRTWVDERAAVTPDMQEVRARLQRHRAQPLSLELLEWANRIVLMDDANARRLGLFVEAARAINTLSTGERIFKSAPIIRLGDHHTPRLRRIPDPAFMKTGGPEAAEAFRSVETATRALVMNGEELR